MERNLTYFVSDVHLGLDAWNMVEREERFLSFLRSIPKDKTEALYLLGDIWDFWYEFKDVVPRGYVRILNTLLELMDAGVEVYFTRGNHDIWTFGYLDELGIKVIPQPYITTIGGKQFCLGHGDGLGPGMIDYKIMAWAFRNKVLQYLFGLLHPTIVYYLGRRMSVKSRFSRALEYDFKGEKEPLYIYSVELSKKHHIDYFVYGHYHTYVDTVLPTGPEMIIMGDWIKDSPYLVYDSTTGIFGYSQKIDQ